MLFSANRDLESEEAEILKQKAGIEERLEEFSLEQNRLIEEEQECDRNANEYRRKEQVFFIR